MKKSFFIIFLFFITYYSMAQPYYSKITAPDIHLSSYTLGNLIFKNDTLIFNTYPVEEVDGEFYTNTYLTKYLNDGQLISNTKLGIQSRRSRILLDDEKLLTLGTFKESTRDSLQILLINGNVASPILEIFNPYGYLSLGSHYQFLKYKTHYLIFCSGEYFFLNKNKEYKPYLIWINNDFTLDTVMQLDLPYGELFDYGIDDDGHLNILAQYHSDKHISGPNMTKNYQGYIKIDAAKNIKHTYFEEQKHIKYPFTKVPQCVFYPDGTKIMTGPYGDELRIIAMGKNDQVLWQDSTYRDQNLKYNEHVSYAKCHNGDLIVLATNIHKTGLSDSKVHFETSFIQRYDKDGKEKFFRSYGYYTVNESQSAGNWLFDTKELGPNHIIAIGGVRKSPQDLHSIYPNQMYNDSTWILSIDSLGCIDKDKCNDVIAWNAPNNLYQYDQINVRHKEWYFSNDKGRYVQSFGRDTNMFDRPQYGWLRYRPILTKNLDTGVETKDTVFATWAPEGRMYISPRNYNPFAALPIYPLYDFTLKLQDTFTLPYNYGKAIVTQVDSIALIPGYLRKRIVLQHHNPTNQAKYGDLTWIEGIGSPNGILYYKDWQEGTKTELTCYYDRGEKRYSSTNDLYCRKPILIKPEFAEIGPFCIGSAADNLPRNSINAVTISGKWSPESINTSVIGTFKFIFTPDDGQNADTTSIFIQITDKVTPIFNIETSYSLNDTPQNLPVVSENGVVGIWSPSEINTQFLGSSIYTFVPIENSCAYTVSKEINVLNSIDTTDMHSSTIWYSSSYTGNWADGDCRKKIDITKAVRDTIIGNRFCRIIGVKTGDIYLPESEIAIYSKAGKMYFYDDDEWKLLYDFTAKVGDTITYYVSKRYPYYVKYGVPAPFDPELINDNPYQLVIKDIDTIFDNSGKPLKRFLTESLFNIHGHFMGEIIENIGSQEKLFGNNVIIALPECSPFEEGVGLRCYSDDDIFIQFTNGECDKLTSTKDLSTKTIKIHPNPGQDRIFFNLSDGYSLPVTLLMTDITGKLLWSDIRHMTNFDIDTSLLTSGLYIITIRDSQGKISTCKWVKE